MNARRALLWLAPGFGVAFAVLTPPLHGPDENRHLNRAYMIASGHPWASARQGFRGNEIPWSVLRMQQRLGPEVVFHPDVKQDPDRWRAEFSVALEPERVVFASMPSVHSPLPYLPQALAVAALRPFEPPPVVLLYAARAANLSVWIALLYLALTIAPAHRWSLWVIALSPMSLFVATTASADALTNAVAFVWIALLLRLRVSRTPVSIPIATGLGLLATALGLCKLVYWALIALLGLLPAASFDSARQRIVRLGAIAVGSGLPTLGMFALASGITELDATFTDPRAQTELLRNDPLAIVTVLWESLRIDGLRWWEQFVGVLGWLDTQLPGFAYPLYALLLAGVVWQEAPTPGGLTRPERALLLAVPVVVTVALLVNGFIRWTAPGELAVRSFQGRYLIAVAPLVAIALQRRRAPGLSPAACRVVVGIGAGMLATGCVSLALRYHGIGLD